MEEPDEGGTICCTIDEIDGGDKEMVYNVAAMTLETLPEAGLPPTIETEMMNAANAMPMIWTDVFVTVTVAPPKVPEPDTAVAVRT